MNRIIKVVFILFLLWTMDCGLCTTYAATPRLINYQGRLTDKSGMPLEGSYSVTFRIYDAENAGSLLWQEIHQGLVIQKGVFSVLLGSVTNLDLAFDREYYLEIKVGTEVMTPRQLIASAAYAIRAETAEQAQNADTVGNVGVSVTPQANKILPLDANAKLPVSALKVYDSGWFAISSSQTYGPFYHNLGTTKVLGVIYGAIGSDGTHMSTTKVYASDNLCISHITETTCYLYVRGDIAGIWSGSGDNWDKPTHARIIMLALE